MLTDDARIAILDRGLSAVRLIQAVRELNRERGSSLRTVALFVEADRDSFYVREADGSIGLGASVPGNDAIEAALTATGASAAWAGWDPLGPGTEVEALCERMGIELLG
ncbi:MAG TPA: biotin carboxylase N-terminal domain-containing protein, partial [Actinomycetota bacterium]|nr:biotin carboxylase N-terminal domain-containing protein [Actinomycetota bacterium]